MVEITTYEKINNLFMKQEEEIADLYLEYPTSSIDENEEMLLKSRINVSNSYHEIHKVEAGGNTLIFAKTRYLKAQKERQARAAWAESVISKWKESIKTPPKEEEVDEELELEFADEVVEYEKKVEKEEDERDEKEKKIRERRAEKKRLRVVRRKELDKIFYENWIHKIRDLKALMPDTENDITGVGKDKKFKSYFRRQATLFLHEIKKLNIGGGK